MFALTQPDHPILTGASDRQWENDPIVTIKIVIPATPISTSKFSSPGAVCSVPPGASRRNNPHKGARLGRRRSRSVSLDEGSTKALTRDGGFPGHGGYPQLWMLKKGDLTNG